MSNIKLIFDSISPGTRNFLLSMIAIAVTVTALLNVLGIGAIRDALITGYEKSIEAQMDLQRTEIEIQRSRALADLETGEELKILLQEQNTIIREVLKEIGYIHEKISVNTKNIETNKNDIIELDAMFRYSYPETDSDNR